MNLSFLLICQFEVAGHFNPHGSWLSVYATNGFEKFSNFRKALANDGVRNRYSSVFANFCHLIPVYKSEFFDRFFVGKAFFHERKDEFERFDRDFRITFREREIANCGNFFRIQFEFPFEATFQYSTIFGSNDEFDDFLNVRFFFSERLLHAFAYLVTF